MSSNLSGRLCLVSLAYFATFLSANSSIAQEGEPPIKSVEQQAIVSPPASEQILFGGDSLENWKSTNFGGEGEVRLETGSIVLGMGDPLTGVTYQGKDFPKRNYEVSLEARRIEGHDFFCCLTFPVDDSHCSLVVGGWAGTIVGLSCLDDQDASDNETTREMSFKNETWFQIRVRVTPGRIAAWIDEEQVVDVDVSDKKISIRNEVSLSRPLGICNFRTVAEIRNIQLLRLDRGDLPASAESNDSR